MNIKNVGVGLTTIILALSAMGTVGYGIYSFFKLEIYLKIYNWFSSYWLPGVFVLVGIVLLVALIFSSEVIGESVKRKYLEFKED